jgi:hypothetical protein
LRAEEFTAKSKKANKYKEVFTFLPYCPFFDLFNFFDFAVKHSARSAMLVLRGIAQDGTTDRA